MRDLSVSGIFPISEQAAETFPISVKMDVPVGILKIAGANKKSLN